MSLTSEIARAESPLSQYFKSNFAKLPEMLRADNLELANCGSLLPSDEKNYPWAAVGHMTEYLICLSVGVSVQSLMPMVYLKESASFASLKLIKEITDAFNCTLNADSPKFATQCKYLFELAQMEDSLRATGKINFKFDYPEVSSVVLEDLRAIFNNSIKGNDMLKGKYYYNPSFDLSPLVGGADADLLKMVDSKQNILLEIKTTKHVAVNVNWIYQLVGYAFLDRINYFKIHDLAIYLPRQNVMLSWSLEEIILQATGFESVKAARREFVKCVKSL